MDDATKRKYLPLERRTEILKKRFEAYQEQIIGCEVNILLVEYAIDTNKDLKGKKKVGEKEIAQMKEKIFEWQSTIETSYLALQKIADLLIIDEVISGE